VVGGYGCELSGCAPQHWLSEIVEYDPATKASIAVGRLPTARDGVSVASDGTYVYVFGGRLCTLNCTYYLDIYRFNPQSKALSIVGALPSERAFTAAAYSAGRFYVFGGLTPSGLSTAEVVEFTPGGSAVVKANLEYTSYAHTALATGGRIFIFGGYAPQGFVNLIQWYEPATNTRQRVCCPYVSLPGPRAYLSASWDGTTAFLFGGSGNGDPFDEIVTYQPDGVPVVSEIHLPSGRYGTAAVFTGKKHLVFGGAAKGQVLTAETFSWARGNRAPIAAAAVRPSPAECVGEQATVTLDASGSVDPDGDPLTYSWTSSRGTVADPNAPSTSAVFPVGATDVTVSVSDDNDHGGFAAATARVVDTVAPSTNASLSGTQGNAGWYRSSVTVGFSVSDACTARNSRTNWSVDGRPPGSGARVEVQGDGAHEVRFWTEDLNGNVEQAKSTAFRTDGSGPDVRFLRPKAGSTYVDDQENPGPVVVTVVRGDLSVQADANDPHSGLECLEFRVDSVARARRCAAPFSWVWPARSEPTGLHRLEVTASDIAGNTSSTALDVLVLS
jgi:hypothetical protein